MDRFAILWPCSKITTPEVFRKSSAPLLGPFATLKVLKTVIIINFQLQRAVIINVLGPFATLKVLKTVIIINLQLQRAVIINASISATPNFHPVSKNIIQLCPLICI